MGKWPSFPPGVIVMFLLDACHNILLLLDDCHYIIKALRFPGFLLMGLFNS